MRTFEQDVDSMTREEIKYWAIQFLKHSQRVDEVLKDMYGDEILYEVSTRIIQKYGRIENYENKD